MTVYQQAVGWAVGWASAHHSHQSLQYYQTHQFQRFRQIHQCRRKPKPPNHAYSPKTFDAVKLVGLVG
ncbi:hypothetical protein NLA_13370 [Neisseria lactamica 020-06]|uniref:Uncharacterized protein n=1 Tax=Neisseria lactamica (strain 020-06) TaxID=489653 RepID=E4ZDX2_NEIL0|nr:hypothetical protein NLA_13370 [Neisseria lactamica 020-06]